MSTVESAGARSVRSPGPCPRAGCVTRSACARPRAWWTRPPACAWSKASSTTAPRMRTMRAPAQTSPAPAHRPTAALDGPSWPLCPLFCPAWSATCPPRAWPNWDRSVTTRSAGLAAAARACKAPQMFVKAWKQRLGHYRSSRGHDSGPNRLMKQTGP